MSELEEKDYEQLKDSCSELKDFIQDVQEENEIDNSGKKRLDQIQKNIVSETSVLVNKHLKKKLSEIKQRVDPLIKETNDLIESIQYLDLDPVVVANEPPLFEEAE